jgi:hypothetical protein
MIDGGFWAGFWLGCISGVMAVLVTAALVLP